MKTQHYHSGQGLLGRRATFALMLLSFAARGSPRRSHEQSSPPTPGLSI